MNRDKALKLDAEDPLKAFRQRFALPPGKIYLCNNSLGLPPVAAFTKMQEQMQKWAEKGVGGWADWYTYFEESLRGPLAELLGAKEKEVVVMNSLTVNLHLLMTSFYQPSEARRKILIDGPTFPSDLYALKSHLCAHGLDPDKTLVILRPRPGEHLLRQEDIERAIIQEGSQLALVWISSVNFVTGQLFDMAAITALAHKQGALVGFDLAHAAGNIPLDLHASCVDFAVGCSYKYLCGGPGGPGIAFIHTSYHDKVLPRLSGWWGNDPATRFQMQLQPEFIPHGGAVSWQVSTPSILSMTPLAAALELFEEVGMAALRKKSEKQTAFLLELLEGASARHFEVITPGDPKERGSQLSLLFYERGEEVVKNLEKLGVICDYRPPGIVRVTAQPLYNSFQEIDQFVDRLIVAMSKTYG